jgi:transcriptional regulator with XRE-family HTH domain
LQDPEKIIGARIRALREQRGLNQDELARQAGLNRVHLYRVETGRQSPTIRTLAILAAALKVRIADLVIDI